MRSNLLYQDRERSPAPFPPHAGNSSDRTSGGRGERPYKCLVKRGGPTRHEHVGMRDRGAQELVNHTIALADCCLSVFDSGSAARADHGDRVITESPNHRAFLARSLYRPRPGAAWCRLVPRRVKSVYLIPPINGPVGIGQVLRTTPRFLSNTSGKKSGAYRFSAQRTLFLECGEESPHSKKVAPRRPSVLLYR
jgi:hypothetical protein